MPKDFSGQNLRGRSFKGLDLTEANFSYADIRGANFTAANLTRANFSYATAGLQRRWAIFWVAVSSLLAALSGFASVSTNGISWWRLGNQAYQQNALIFGVVMLGLFSVFFLISIQKSLTASLGTWMLTLVGASAFWGVGHAFGHWSDEIFKWASVIAAALAVALGVAGIIAGTVAVAGTVVKELTGVVIVAGALTGGAVGALVRVLVRGGGSVLSSAPVSSWNWAWVDLVWAWTWAWALALIGGYIGRRVLSRDKQLAIVQSLSVAIAAIGGTRFCKANLTDANFTQATLKSTDFSGAILTRTRWYEAKKLDLARVGESILRQPSVRNLLVSGNGYKKSYEGANFKEANLVGANLIEANLREANISQAILQGANLEGANLTQVQAVGTNFTKAYLTGACLEAWHIDSTTTLEQVDCRYVYLLQGQRERRPNSGEFQPREFTKLFQEVLNTVDLIFRNGVDWKAFITAFKQVQVENEGTDLAIQSIENKGDGIIVVKVSVPPDTDKEKIHREFTPNYELALKAIAEKYQAKLEAKDELLRSYRQQIEDSRQRELQQSANLQEIINILASRPMNVPVNVPEVKAIAERQSLASKLVILMLGYGDFINGFPSVTVQIWAEVDRLPTQCIGQLPPAPEIPELYSRWQSLYHNLGLRTRLEFILNQDTNFSNEDIEDLAEELEEQLNRWLNSESFRPIDKLLREKFMHSDEILLIIQSENLELRQIPWHLWDFLKSYRKAQYALSSPLYNRVEKPDSQRAVLRILAILGKSTGIDVEEDRKVLGNLGDAETVFLVEPTRQEFDKQLWDEQGWDIICFSGHSSSQWDGRNGWLEINKTDKLTIDQLENALTAAIERGLQLAIFNSCDGLGLARQLASLHIPQIIVMREPVPDRVAQEFLKNFLTAFASGKSLYLAVRQAREMLQGLENDFPCATWLPVICQNPAEGSMIWSEFR